MLLAFESTSCQDVVQESDKAVETSLRNLDDLDDLSIEDMSATEPDQVFVQLGDDISQFTVAKLKQLPYFESLFSKRWMELHNMHKQQNSNEEVTINVFGNDETAIPQFSCTDLNLLLLYEADEMEQFYKHFSSIKTECNNIDKLLFCGDYFNCPIEKEIVINLIQSRTPALSQNDIKTWLTNEAKHCTLKEALCDLIESWKQQISSLKNKKINIDMNEFKKDENFCIDADTAALIFLKMLENVRFIRNEQLQQDEEGQGSNLKIVIDNFDKNEWKKIQSLFDFSKYFHYWKKPISKIATSLENCSPCMQLDVEYDEMIAIWGILTKIPMVKDDHCDVFHISRFAKMKSKFVLMILGGYIHPTMGKEFESDYFALEEKEKHQFALLVLQSADRFLGNCGDFEKKSLYRNFFKFLKSVVCSCKGAFMVNHANLWFPILHRQKLVECMPSDENKELAKQLDIVTWVVNDIIPKLTTQQAFEFGLYLVDYAVFEKNDCNGTLDQQYVSYLKIVGIEWNILPQ